MCEIQLPRRAAGEYLYTKPSTSTRRPAAPDTTRCRGSASAASPRAAPAPAPPAPAGVGTALDATYAPRAASLPARRSATVSSHQISDSSARQNPGIGTAVRKDIKQAGYPP